MTLEITALYTAILAIFLIVLRTIVSLERAKTDISILHQDNISLAEKMRRHGNFVENVPHALLLLATVETLNAPGNLLHSMGILLIISRLLHPLGLTHERTAHPLRIFSGILGTVSMVLGIGYVGWYWMGA